MFSWFETHIETMKIASLLLDLFVISRSFLFGVISSTWFEPLAND